MAEIRTVVVVNDLHCGSTVGLLPPDYQTIEGNVLQQNAIQRWLWQCWIDATQRWLSELVGSDPFALVVNGDATEGIHHKNKQVVSPDESDHLAIAAHVLTPLAERAVKTFVVLGTECHTHSCEVGLGGMLGAEVNQDTKKSAYTDLHLRIADVPNSFNHHIGATSRPYLESGQFSIHMAVERMEAMNAGHEPPRVMWRAHRHRFGQYTDGQSMLIVGAPWQTLTRHGHKVVTGAKTRPGLCVGDWRRKEDGELPDVHHIQYRPPAPKEVVL